MKHSNNNIIPVEPSAPEHRYARPPQGPDIPVWARIFGALFLTATACYGWAKMLGL